MKLEKLTPEQEALIPVIRDKWISQLFDLKEINIPQLTEGVNWLYTFCKMEIPKIIICESLLESQILVNILKNLTNVGDNVRANVWDKNIQHESICSYGDINDYGWVSFYNFFSEIGILNNPNFNLFVNLLQSNYFTMIQMDKVCIIVKNPKHILLNDQKQMNSTKDYAIKFNDETGMYFVNGFYLSDELFLKLSNKEYTFEDFSIENNEEVKSAIISFYQQEFGDEFLFRFFSKNLKEVNVFVDKKKIKYLEHTTNGMNIGVYTLFKGKINNIDIAYIRCFCPSTDRMFFLGVDSSNTNAKDAIASLYRIPKILVSEIETISRQGEKFSTTFTKNGNSLLKSLTEEQVKDLVSIDGNTYFKKMTYEF